MKKLLLVIFSVYFSTSLAQETILTLSKIDQNNFNIDGIISDNEINNAVRILYS